MTEMQRLRTLVVWIENNPIYAIAMGWTPPHLIGINVPN